MQRAMRQARYGRPWPPRPPANPQQAKKNERGLNENYGRELMELHTLGVDGGYTQKDVTEVARCFTGWTIQEPRRGGGFFYNDNLHDKGEKVVLGQVIPAGGGIEVQVIPRWSVKGEYLYADLGRANHTFVFTGVPAVTDSALVTLNIVRAGVNFRF